MVLSVVLRFVSGCFCDAGLFLLLCVADAVAAVHAVAVDDAADAAGAVDAVMCADALLLVVLSRVFMLVVCWCSSC